MDIRNSLTYDRQHRQSDFFYGGTIHMNSSVSKKEIDKKSIMFLFDLYKQKIPKQIKLTFDQ